MKVTYRMMVAEFLLILILTFMLSLGHIIVSNVFSEQAHAGYFVLVYCLNGWICHRISGLHKVPCGFIITILCCIVTFVLTECMLHKSLDEKGCRVWVVEMVNFMKTKRGMN